jgi:hypothetical protein
MIVGHQDGESRLFNVVQALGALAHDAYLPDGDQSAKDN